MAQRGDNDVVAETRTAGDARDAFTERLEHM
jgi:hypothetical protein